MYSDMTQSQHPRCINSLRSPRVPGADPQRQGEEEQGDTVVGPHAGFLCSRPPDPAKSCQPLLETLRQAIDGTVPVDLGAQVVPAFHPRTNQIRICPELSEITEPGSRLRIVIPETSVIRGKKIISSKSLE